MRFRKYLIAATTLIAFSVNGARAEEVSEPVVEPQIDRRDVKLPRIEVRDFELGAFIGMFAIEDFGTEPLAGLRGTYHVSEDFFVELNLALSQVSDASFRRLGIAIFEEETVPLTYYNLSVGYNLYPGELFRGRERAWSSAVYFVGGIGNTGFGDEDYLTYNLGLGLRVVPSDGLTLRFELRDHLFQSDLLGENELKQNFELSGGLSWFF